MSRFKSPTNALMSLDGYSESNAEKNSALAAFVRQDFGITIDPASTAWCAEVQNAALGAPGQQGTDVLNARSFLNWGKNVDNVPLAPGQIVALHPAPFSVMPPLPGAPRGTQLNSMVNPPPPSIQLAQLATRKFVPVGTRTSGGGTVTNTGAINFGSWSTPGAGQSPKWWQANNPGNW